MGLASTTTAVLTSGCAATFKDVTDDKAVKDCKCADGCMVCKHAVAGTAAAKTTAGADQCFVCDVTSYDIDKAATTDLVGKCKAKPGAGGGKRAAGKICDATAKDAGCADGLRCATTKGLGMATPSICGPEEACGQSTAGISIECGAIQIGATVAAALAIVSQL